MSQEQPTTCPQCNHVFAGGQNEPNDKSKDDPIADTRDPCGDPAPSIRIAGLESRHSEHARRGRKTWKGHLLRTTVAAASLLLLICAGWVVYRSIPASWQSSRPARVVTLPANARASAPSSDVSRRLVALIGSFENRIVKIESDQAGHRHGLGSGFVIDESGLIATSYHVISETTQARVSFQNGTVFDVAGYAAVDPQTDLAIVKLSNPPASLAAMKLRHQDDPPQLTPVIAIGHPQGIEFSTFDGTVSKVLDTNQLPSHSRKFLSDAITGSVNHRWIQHTAKISEGSSGGPLVNHLGEVVGINTWVDRRTGTGYALHARYLQRLRHQLLPRIAPLSQFARADARTVALLKRLSAGRVKSLLDSSQAMKWQPTSESDYEVLGNLAWAVTFAQLPSTGEEAANDIGLDEPQMRQLKEMTATILAVLRSQPWDGTGQILMVNEFAAQQVNKPRAGVFLFADVERVVDGDDGQQAVLLRLSGTDQMLFVPVEGALEAPRPGTSCLLLGVNYDGRTVRYGENPLQPIIAPVIISRTILPFGP